MVKAWAERPESSDEEEESGSDQPRRGKNKSKSFARKLTKRVKSATRKDDNDESKPRRRSIFTRAMPFIGGSMTDLDSSYPDGRKDNDKPRRRSLFVRAKPLDSGTLSDTEGYTKAKGRRRSLFDREKPPVSGVLSDTESSTANLKKKEKGKIKKPRRESLFARGKATAAGSYSDTEGYPEKKDELKPRRRSLFARPKSASSVPFFENKGFTPEKTEKLRGSPSTKKKASSMIEISNFSPVSETEGESEEELKPTPTEMKPSTTRLDLQDSTVNRLVTRLTNEENPSVRRVDSEDRWKELNHFRPGNRLKPLKIESTIKEHEGIGRNDRDNFVSYKNSKDIMKTQHRLKPLDIKPPLSEDESTDDENKTTTTDTMPRATRQDMMKHNLVVDMRRPTSEDEVTDDENQARKNDKNTEETVYQNRLKPTDIPRQLSDDEVTDDEGNPTKTDGKPKVNRQRVMELILRGTARAVGRLQHRAKMPKFNFEKYISYLQNVLPSIGFKIMGITVTWEMVSTILFLEVSLLALFMQESIFGNQQANVAL